MKITKETQDIQGHTHLEFDDGRKAVVKRHDVGTAADPNKAYEHQHYPKVVYHQETGEQRLVSDRDAHKAAFNNGFRNEPQLKAEPQGDGDAGEQDGED